MPETNEHRLSIHDSIHLIRRSVWDVITKGAGPYLLYDHLGVLEDVMAGTMQFRYAIFSDARYRPVGVACFQILDLEDNGSAYGEAVRRLGAVIGARVVKELKVRSLVCGNVFHLGDHGVQFIKGISLEDQLSAVDVAMAQVRTDARIEPRIAVSIFKDVVQEQTAASALENRGYHPLAMDLNMVMDISPSWIDLDGYQRALTSKARTRIRSIFGRSPGLVVTSLSAQQIKALEPTIQLLFDQVLERAPFVFGRLNVAVYSRWKTVHGDGLMFRGFFVDGALVGFSAAFVVGDTLDAQYVGIDYTQNEKHMIYQRMLLDLLDLALQHGLRHVNFGRTAEQAKSSLGAGPVQLPFYVKHRNKMANVIIGPFLRKVKPSDFGPRTPFKKVGP